MDNIGYLNNEDEKWMSKYMKDEVDEIPVEYDSCGIKSPLDHKLMFKTLENPLRRRIVKSIGEFGKSKAEIINEVEIGEDELKFQLDYLVKECYIEMEGEVCRLNEKGKDELLKNIVSPLR